MGDNHIGISGINEFDIDVVWTHIGFVRKKLRSIKADVEIKTIRGSGYSLEVSTC